jgi:hypothetical protein
MNDAKYIGMDVHTATIGNDWPLATCNRWE